MNGILVKFKIVNLLWHPAGVMGGQFANFDKKAKEDGVFFLTKDLKPFYYLFLGDLCGQKNIKFS